MIPQTIQAKLAGLRGRERLLQLTWGAARWLALVLLVLLACGFVDWVVDREIDTPFWLRQVLFVGQIVLGLALAGWLLIWPLTRSATDAGLSLKVEDRYPQLGHRLISAVQLNHPGADTEGMSPELISLVTRQAETQAAKLNFAAVADHRRLKWSTLVAGPALLLFAAPFILWPSLAIALLARQFLADKDIPHRIAIEAVTPYMISAAGDPVLLEFRVTGLDPDAEEAGQATIQPQGQALDTVKLIMTSENRMGEATFTAEVPPGSTDFTYTARLGDGRLRKPGTVRYVSRPVVTDVQAWLLYPKFCGVDAKGNPYEQQQARGDIVGIAGSSARVRLNAQKPITAARLELYGPADFDPAKSADESGPEVLKRTFPMLIDEASHAVGAFELRLDETSYVLKIEDEHGFMNQPPPRRKVRLVDEEKPTVTLLREQFPPANRLSADDLSEDYEVEGLPVPLGKDIRVAFFTQGPYGLGQARLLYRLVKKVDSDGEETGPNPWSVLPLPEQDAASAAKLGRFNPRVGVFERSGLKDQVFFHAAQAAGSPLPRSHGGGRFDFKTSGILDVSGRPLKLKVGDQIEYCVEVFADKDIKANRPSNRSETRVKTIVSEGDFALWVGETLQVERRIRMLDSKQRGQFEEK